MVNALLPGAHKSNHAPLRSMIVGPTSILTATIRFESMSRYIGYFAGKRILHEKNRLSLLRPLVAIAAVAGAVGFGRAAAIDRACRRGRGARRGRGLFPGASLRAPARLAVPAAGGV